MRKIDTNPIQWPKAVYWTKQWNPWIGCQPVSPACEHCYAAAIARRFKLSFTPHRTKQKMPKTGVVFCGNMTDCFGGWAGHDDVVNWFGQMHHANPEYDIQRNPYVPQKLPNEDAVYLWLTKRVGNLMNALVYAIAEHPQAYYGFTAENQHWYDVRARELFRRQGRKIIPIYDEIKRRDRMYKAYRYEFTYQHWVSCEPLLGKINLHLDEMVNSFDAFDCGGQLVPLIRWVVVGCESGPQRRPCKLEWVENIVRQCQEHHTPVFVKQLDMNGKCVTDINQFPAHLRIRQVPWSNKENT